MLPVFQAQPGFKGYTLVDSEGEVISITSWDSAADGCVAHVADLAGDPRRLHGQLAQRLVLHLVLPPHLLHEELRVGDDLELRQAELARLLEAGDERAVLGDVVRLDADRLAVGGENGAVLGLDDVGRCGGARVPPRAAVGEEACLHAGGSTRA
jgi:hypothetical protein